MPQIGWFEILVIVILSIIIIGPKDFPIMIRKVGNWVGTVKRYFTGIQKDLTNIENTLEDEVSSLKEYSNKKETKKKDE